MALHRSLAFLPTRSPFFLLGGHLLCIMALNANVLSRAYAEDGGSASQGILIAVTTPQGAKLFTELADTPEKRARGLMYRDRLPPNYGMLFTFPEPQQWSFWMKNTNIPLDIIWMDQNKTIVHVEHEVPGCHRQDGGCPQYRPNKKALYVLEVAAGVAERLQLKRGVRLQFPVPPSSNGFPQPGTLPR